MKKTAFLLTAVLSSILLSCKDEHECQDLPEQTIGSGAIISDALVSHPVVTWEMREKEHVIQSDTQNVYNLTVSFDDGATYDTINFSKYTLLGKYIGSVKCNGTFIRNVSVDDKDSTVLYSITVYQCGNCKRNWESMNWVLIPKISDDYAVEFDVEEISV